MRFSIHRSPSDSVTALKIQYNDPEAIQSVRDALQSIFSSISFNRDIVLICIGTDRSTGDSLGPLVGSELDGNPYSNFHLYGTLDEPVHAVNLQDTVSAIYKNHRSPYIVAIDACLGKVSSVGTIQIADGPIQPGAGVHKELPAIGEMHITGIVNVGGFMEYFVLQNTRLNLVVKMAQVIASAVDSALINCNRTLSSAMIRTTASTSETTYRTEQ